MELQWDGMLPARACLGPLRLLHHCVTDIDRRTVFAVSLNRLDIGCFGRRELGECFGALFVEDGEQLGLAVRLE